MKRFLTIILALLLMLGAFSGCQNQNATDDKELTLNKTTLSLSMFGEADIIASYSGIDKNEWSNSNSQVVNMVEHGNYVKITAIKEGVATITASGAEKTATCSIIVSQSEYVLSVELLREGNVEINQNSSLYVPAQATYRGEAVDGATLKYTIEDTSIATVTEDGVVTGIKGGQTTLKIQAEYKGTLSAPTEIQVLVKSGPSLVLSATYFNLYEYSASANKKHFPNTKNFSCYIVDGQNIVTDISASVSGDNDAVAKYESGKITALGAGTAMFTITCNYDGNSYVAYLYVTVDKIPIVELLLSDSALLLFNNGPNEYYPSAKNLTATVRINGRSVSEPVTWAVEEGINAASVNTKGVVTALGEGKATISASYKYKGIERKEFCSVDVVDPITYRTLTADVDSDGVDDIREDMLFVYMTSQNNKIQINNVSLTDTHDLDLIRFGVPNYGQISSIFRLKFRATDVSNPNNWVEFIYSYYPNSGVTGGIMAYAMNTSAWDIGKMIGIASRKSGGEDVIKPMEEVGSRGGISDSSPAGATNMDCSLKFAIEFKEKDYTRNMAGFSVVNDEVSLNFRRNSASNSVPKWGRVNLPIFTKELQAKLLSDGTYQNPVFDGFTKNNTKKVNITVTAVFQNKNVVSPIIIDTLGGTPVKMTDRAKVSFVKG